MEPVGTIFTILLESHSTIIHVEFYQIGPRGLIGEVLASPFKLNMWLIGRGHFWLQKHNLNQFCREPLYDVIYQI